MEPETSSAIGAVTGSVALTLSIIALLRSGLANRRAAPVVRWIDNSLQVTNLGPARAREVSVTLRSEGSTKDRKPTTIAALSNGYTYRLGHHRLMGEPAELTVDLQWKDDRLRQQRDSVLVSQERTRTPEGPTIPDKQVDEIAARLGEGIGRALNDVASGAARTRRR